MRRCRTVAKTARSTANSKPRPASSSSITAAAAGLLPQPPEQQRRTDALAREAGGLLGIVQGGEQQDLLAEAGAGGEQRGEAAAGGEFVGAAEGGDDVLADGAAVAAVLDDLEVAARSGGLEAEEHGALQTEHHDNSLTSYVERGIIIMTWHYILRAVS